MPKISIALSVKQFRKKPVVIEAVQVPSLESNDISSYLNLSIAIAEWCGGRSFMMEDEKNGPCHILIPTLEGDMKALSNDWIIKGVRGEFYPCKPDIFEATYEPA